MGKKDSNSFHFKRKSNRAGAKCKLTPEVQDKIVKVLRAGNYQAVAARLAGISRSTFYNWLDRGKKARKGIYLEFMDAVKKAEAEGEAALLAQINAAGKNTWQAAAWILERKYPDRWGKKEALAITGDMNLEHKGELKHNVRDLFEENPELRRAIARASAILTANRRGGGELAGDGTPSGTSIG